MIVGPLQFDAPLWLLLIPALWAGAWWIARRSLSGLGGRTRWTALALRFIVIALLGAALAEPRWRSPSETVAVLTVVDVSRSMPPDTVDTVQAFLERGLTEKESQDEVGVITAAEESFVQALPSRATQRVDVQFTGDLEGTDLASGVRLAMAVKPEDAAARILLITDGNETSGSLLAAAESAASAGVPIDVLPVDYEFEREIIFQRLISPATARRGQPINLRFVIESTFETQARVTLLANEAPIDLDPESSGVSAIVPLERGVNVRTVPITLPDTGAQRFRAVVEPLREGEDAIAENNAALGVTFVSSEGRVLVYAEDAQVTESLVSALQASEFAVELRDPTNGHDSLIELGGYDAVVLVDTPAYAFSRKQQDELRAYVHDLGGGLVMVGGPNSFGAGGWIGSPLADALPVKLDPPQKREMPRGALALIMHSCEMPRGNYWGQQTALAAVNALSRLDLVGVLEYDWGRGGSAWVHELAEVGDGAAVRRAINNLVFGDMPDFTPTMNLALQGLANVNAGQKHCIIISDGDPAPPSRTLLQGFIDAKITISTVAVFPHGGPGSMDLVRMREIARITGGNYYQVTSQAQLASLPQIFVKEAQTVKRSLIWEGDPFTPTFVNLGLESMRGFGAAMPPMVGYVVTAEREGLSLVSMKSPQEDPILAQWQHGLGRSVAFTSDAATRWSPEWVTWEGFQAFWDQQLRWAMRPTGSANVNVITETQGDETLVIVEALDSAGERLNFAQFAGRVVTPEMDSEPVELRQTGAGRYEGRIRTEDAGSYVLNLRYDAVQQGEDGEPRVERGAVQAAVTRPFADEHRALKDNAPLLYEAARLTGGRVLDRSDAAPLLFSRAGLEMPVATRPIWLALALAGLALFLMDVAVRRVRIDVRAIVRAGRLALTKRRQAAGEQIDALRAAREKARGAMAERGSGGRVETPPQGPQAVRPATTKGVKFEASQEAFKRAEKGEMGSVTDSVKPKERPAAEKKTEAEKKKDEQPEEGMSRLLQAKKRAREQMRGDEDRKND